MTNYELVKKWHEDFGAAVGESPRMIDGDLSNIRIKLIKEELQEYIDAIAEGDLYGAAKELGDLLWVCYGSCVTHGFDADALMAEIAWSNNTKRDDEGNPIVRPDGKILKGPNYLPPKLVTVLGVRDEVPR